jgi:uncharacterized protein (DUF2235 family)
MPAPGVGGFAAATVARSLAIVHHVDGNGQPGAGAMADDQTSEEPGRRTVIALCDGTANHLGGDLSNVARMFRCLVKDERQRVYYNSGVGTVGADSWWSDRARRAKALFEQASGYAIDRDIIAIYRWLCITATPDDRICLFGFSRGAYTVRVVAALIHTVGLLPPDQADLAGYALSYLKKISEPSELTTENEFARLYEFSRITGGRQAGVHFLGLFDTVASLILPRRNGPFPGLATIPFTRRNSSVRAVRHACAIDERRAMFRLNRWAMGKPFVENPFARPQDPVPQDVKQVWFSGVHADIGGGYPETEAGLAKIPLTWMIAEAQSHGIRFMKNRVRRFVLEAGATDLGPLVAPDPAAEAHESLAGGHRLFEWIPKASRFAEWKPKPWPVYLPRGERRNLTGEHAGPDVRTPVPLVHASVERRIAAGRPRPPNLPSDYAVEPEVLPT